VTARAGDARTLAAIGAGGVLGAEARYGVGQGLPHAADAVPWSTVLINGTGCLLIGALMVIVLELTDPHPLARPFLGVGVLGGYTTFSTFAVDTDRLLHLHCYGRAVAYVVATVAACLGGVYTGTVAARLLGRRRPRDTGGAP
jgi:CrcB protein